MALTITTRKYADAQAGYTALVADLKTMADWTEIIEDNGSAEGTTVFKKYNDAEGKQYVAIRVKQGGKLPLIAVQSVDGETVYDYTLPTGEIIYRQYVTFVKWDGGFYAHCTEESMPSTNLEYVGFGLGFGTNLVHQSSKWCAWLGKDAAWHIASPGTTSADTAALPTHYGGKFALSHPLTVPDCEYSPDRLLYLRQVSESCVNTCGYCTWNGRRYYKNGCMLVPTE